MHNQTSLFSGSPFDATSTRVNQKIYIGFDPGADGGVVVLQGNEILEKHTVPKREERSTKAAKTRDGEKKKDARGKLIYNMKKVMDEVAYCEIVKGLKIRYPDAVAVIERVKNIQSVGAVQNFMFGHNFGLIRGFIIACGFKSFHQFTPQEWQKIVLHERDHKWSAPGVKDTKGTTLNAFLRIFPNVDMRASSRSTNYHDGLVDAATIAKAAQIKNL